MIAKDEQPLIRSTQVIYWIKQTTQLLKTDPIDILVEISFHGSIFIIYIEIRCLGDENTTGISCWCYALSVGKQYSIFVSTTDIVRIEYTK